MWRYCDRHKVVEGWLLSPGGWPEVLLKFHSAQDSFHDSIVWAQTLREWKG